MDAGRSACESDKYPGKRLKTRICSFRPEIGRHCLETLPGECEDSPTPLAYVTLYTFCQGLVQSPEVLFRSIYRVT